MRTSSSTSRFPTTARSTSSRIRSESEATCSSSAMAMAYTFSIRSSICRSSAISAPDA